MGKLLADGESFIGDRSLHWQWRTASRRNYSRLMGVRAAKLALSLHEVPLCRTEGSWSAHPSAERDALSQAAPEGRATIRVGLQ